MMYEKLRRGLQSAMKEKHAVRISTLRLILAAVKDKQISMRSGNTEDELNVDDSTVIDVLSKMRKQRIDSVAMYEEAGRIELADAEREEITIIDSYLPEQLSEAEIEAVVRTRVGELRAEGLRDMGRVMASLKETHAGKMDFSLAGRVVKAKLAS